MEQFLFPIASDTTEALSDKQTIKATAHAAKVGDVVVFLSGNNVGRRSRVRVVTDANTLQLLDTFNASFAVGDEFAIYRLGTPKKAKANVAASQTDSSLVTAVAGKILRVLGVVAVAGATATDLTFNTKPAGAGTAISPLFANDVRGGIVLPETPSGWWDTSSGEGLTVTTGAGSTTGISVIYVEL
jgi:hypothetical protein